MTYNASLPAMPQSNSENLCRQAGTPSFEHSDIALEGRMAIIKDWGYFYADNMLDGSKDEN